MNCNSSLFAVPHDEELCQTIFDSLPVAVLVADLDGGNYFVNRCAASMTGYSPEELMKGVWMVHPDDTEALAICQKALHDGTPGRNYETRMVRKDGSIFWVSISWNPVKDGAGRVIGLCTVFADISDKKGTEHALQDASQRYKMLTENATDMFFEWDTEGIISFASPSVRQLGYSPDGLLGTSVFDLVHPDDRQQSRARRSEHLADWQPQRYEVRFIARNGSVRWMEAQIGVLLRDDHPMTIQAIIRDITERKRAEDELRQASERYRMLVDHASDIFTEWDSEGNIVYASPAIVQLGFTSEEVIGRNVFTMVPAERRAVSEERLRKLLRDHQPLRHELQVVAKDGSIRWLEAQVNVVADGDSPVRIYALHRDISERRAAEQALRESQQRYKNIVENTNEMIMLTTPEGKVAYVSPASTRINGYTPAEIVADNPWVIHPEDTEKMRSLFMRAREGLPESGVEYRIVTKTGEIRWVSHSWAPILDDERVATVVSVVSDITERKNAEQALHVAQQALAENESKYKSIVENSSDLISLTSADGTLLYASPAVATVTGYTFEELAEKRPWIVHPDDSAWV